MIPRTRSLRTWLGFGLLAAALTGLSPTPDVLHTVRPLAIQHNGRYKPFDTYAREVLDSLSGSPQVGRQDPVATVLAIAAEPERWQDEPLLSVPFIPLREAIGLDRKTGHVSYNHLVGTRKLMRMLPAIVEKQQRDEKLTMLEQETMDLYERFVTFNGLLQQDLMMVPPATGAADRTWTSIRQSPPLQATWTAFVTALQGSDAEALRQAAGRLAAELHAVNPSAYPVSWRLQLEVFYNHLHPFRIAQLLYLAAAVAFLLAITKGRQPHGLARGLLWTAFLTHVSGIALRVILGGRPPVSNFYETTLWLPLVAVVLALVLDRIYRASWLGLSAGLLAALALVIADHLPLDPSISPVVAVLRSNLWLTIHVLTIVASYGALALATVLAHLYGILFLRQAPSATRNDLELYLYRTIQVGVVLLASGIMLGAVWANQSWGRYWGWDPKETWALITLLWFLAALHGRFAGWLKGIGLALSTVSGFFLLLMTYYGVSFYLVGLHSYAGGHAKPLPPALIAYVVAELAFIATVSLAATRRPASA